jgi:hypothetical protein
MSSTTESATTVSYIEIILGNFNGIINVNEHRIVTTSKTVNYKPKANGIIYKVENN